MGVLSSEEIIKDKSFTTHKESITFGGGGGKFSSNPHNNLKNINSEVLLMNNISNVKYQPIILNQFNKTNQTFVKVIIDLKDSSYANNLISTLSEKNAKNIIHRDISPGTIGVDITEEEFNKLVNDSRINKIYFNAPVHGTLSESVPLINVNPEVWNLGYTGNGVKICVIDTGVNASHPALNGKIVDEHCYCSNNCCPDNTAEDNSAEDDHGHGTHVTGIIASQNSTYRGVAYGADIYVVKALDSNNDGSMLDIRPSIEWCISKNVDVISISIGDGQNHPGSSACPSTIDVDINNATSHNIPVIIASGNDGYITGINYPACSPNAIPVGMVYDASSYLTWINASCSDEGVGADTIACASNRASNLDLLAPGYDIKSTGIKGDFENRGGTSMAAPHVAGAAALLLEKDPSLTPDEIEQVLYNTGESINDTFNSRNNGEGSNLIFKRINVLAAIESLDQYSTNGTGSLCNESGYEQCYQHSYGDCVSRIAVNYYDAVNNISWGNISDSSDPYVIDKYNVGWKGTIAKDVYYNVVNASNDCNTTYGGCNTGDILVNTGIKDTVNAPGIATTESILGYNETPATYWCWAQFNGFNPSYTNGTNPIYVLNCYNDEDCSYDKYCNKTGNWSEWDCVDRKIGGQSCIFDYECSSGYCDNDGVGLADDNWCFNPYASYFDSQEYNNCEYSTGNGTIDCDEKIVGSDLDYCEGVNYYEEECSSNCSNIDAISVFECTDTDCSCTQPLCDGLTTGSNITTCSAGETYFADKCTSSAEGEDRDNICRNESFAVGCTASDECNGIIAGTGNCDLSCDPFHEDKFKKVVL